MERLISTIMIKIRKHCYDWLKIQNYKVSFSAIGLILWLIKRREVKEKIYRNLRQVRSCNYFEHFEIASTLLSSKVFFSFPKHDECKKQSDLLVTAI